MNYLFPEPSAKEDKPSFDSVPDVVLHDIEKRLSDKIVSGVTAYGGFSASAGFVITFASGRKVFAKGNHPQEMAHGTQQLRQEIAVYETCPVLKDVSPAYLGCIGDGDEDGWLLGLWEFVPSSAIPLDDLVKSLVHFQQEKAPMLQPAQDQNYIAMFLNAGKKWLRIKNDPAVTRKFLTLLHDGCEWFDANIETLVGLQSQPVTGPQGLMHGDLRLDNFLYDGERAYVIDWPNACRGPLIFDLMFLFANLEALGVCTIEQAFDLYTVHGGHAFTSSEKSVMAGRIAGFFADQAYRSVPDRLPRLRWMQKGILFALLRYLSRLGIIDSSPKPLLRQN